MLAGKPGAADLRSLESLENLARFLPEGIPVRVEPKGSTFGLSAGLNAAPGSSLTLGDSSGGVLRGLRRRSLPGICFFVKLTRRPICCRSTARFLSCRWRGYQRPARMDLRSCWRFLKQPPIRVPRPLPMMAPLLLAVIRRCASS